MENFSMTANGIVNSTSSPGSLSLGNNLVDQQRNGQPQHFEPTTSHFWNTVEKGLFTKIPSYVKNLMTMVGFDNHISVRRLNSEDIDSMEAFGRDDAKDFVDSRMELSKIYGIYSQHPEHFKILPGHKRLIEAVRDFVASKPNEYFASQKRALPNLRLPLASEVAHYATGSISTDNIVQMSYATNQSDLQKEKRQLERLISSWMTSNCPPNLLQEPLLVEVAICTDNPESSSSLGLTGSVKCSVCHSLVKVGTSPTKSGKRWIISNFVRHVRGHYAKDIEEQAKNDAEHITVWPDLSNYITSYDSGSGSSKSEDNRRSKIPSLQCATSSEADYKSEPYNKRPKTE